MKPTENHFIGNRLLLELVHVMCFEVGIDGLFHMYE